MGRTLRQLAVASFVLLLAGCSSVEKKPSYDKIYHYDKPYDYTYLKVIEAGNSMPGWMLEETDKEAGIVSYRNIDYGSLFDRDQQVAQFLVARVDKTRTTVRLRPGFQQISDAEEFFRRIDRAVGTGSFVETPAPIPADSTAASTPSS